MTGGTWTVFTFEVGAYGNGTLNFSGGNLSGNYVFVIGSQSNSTGVVNMSSGTLVAGEFFVGDDGNGTLNLTGGNVSVSRSIIGNNESVANISGGTWSSQNYLDIAGTLNITGGAVSNGNGTIANEAPNGNATVNVSGGRWLNSNELFVGNTQNGTLNLTGGMVAIANGAGNLTLGANGSVGTFNLGNGSSVGSLYAAGVVGGSGTGIVNFNNNANATFTPVLSGNLTVNKLGNGALTLSANNTYTGSTTISAGTLAISGLLGGGNYSANITNNGSLLFASTSNQTLGGVISGTGALTQNGSGTLTLTGANTYNGTTTVTSGTLVSGNLTGSTLILQNGGAYSPGGLNTIDAIDVGGLTLNGGDLLYNLGSATSDSINSAGTATLNGLVVFDFSNLGYSAGSFTLISGPGISSSTFNTANLSYNAVGNFSVSGNFVVSGNSLLFQTTAPAANYTWTGGAGNGSWNAAANWITPPVPGALVYFAGNNQTAVDTDTDQSVGGIVFNAGASAFTISNNTITLTGNVENDSTNTQTINSNIALAKNALFAADSGNLAFGGAISLGANSLAISGGNSTAITGNISGTGSLLKRGTGNLTLSGINSYTGDTLINAGNLIVQGGAALLDSGTVKLAASGATITIGTNETIGSLQGGGTTQINNGQTLTIAQTGNATYAGSVTGTGALTKNGSGTLTLTGNNTYTGATNINSGTLQIAGGTLFSDYFTAGISSGETGTVNMAAGTWSGIAEGVLGYFAGSTGLANMTGGTWSMEEFVVGDSGNGTLNLSGGTLRADSEFDIAGAASSTSVANVSGGTLATGDFYVGLEGNGTLNLTGGVVSIGNGAGNLTLASQAGSFGILNLGNGSTVGSLYAASVVGGSGTAIVNFNNNANGTFSPALGGNLTVNKLGTGTLTLTGNNTYTGATAISAGTLAFNSAYTQTLPGIVSGAGSLLKAGSGSLILTGNNTLTGGTTLAGGVLQTLHAKALGNGALTLSSGTLALGNATTTNLSLSGLTDLVWSSSNAVISLANGGNIVASGNFTNGGNSGNRTFYFRSGQSLQLGNNTLVSFGATNFSESNFVASISGGTTLSGSFQILGTSLVYNLQGGNASGNVIDNSGPYDTPTWVDFTVNGNSGNGTVITAGGNNTIRDLTFANNGNLAIQAGYSLTLSQGQVAVENGSSVVSGGTLATPGNFNKTGAGELDVQSTLSVNGTASIDAGLLSVNGNLIADSVAVNSGAILGGSGTIFAPVTVSGTLAPGNSPGTLSMASLTLTPTAVTDIEIESLTNFDRLVVGGAARVDGTLNVIPYNGNPLAYGQQFAFLTAAGGISGEFDTINAPATFRGRFLKLGTITALQAIYVPADDLTGILLIAPDTYTRVAVTPNQRNVAKALDSFIPATSGDQQTVSIALDLQTAEQYPYAFDQIMPGFYESLANMAIEQAFNQTQMLNQRISSVRLGAAGFQAIGGITQPLVHDKNGKSAAEAKDANPIVESATATNWNAWALGTGMFSRTTNLGSLQNYNNDAGGFLVGSDYRWSENFVTGLYAGYDYSYAEYNGGGSTKGNSFSFGTYASYEKDGYYADAVIGGGYTGFQTQRSIAFGTIDRTASADPNTGQFTAGLNLGKDFEVGKFTLGPIVGAQYTYAGIGSFTKSGAESLDLSLGQQNANSLRTTLGGRIAYTWNLNQKIALIPEVRMFWQHEFLNNPRNINASLDGGSGASFGYETTDPYRNSVFAGAGVTAQFGKNLSGSVFYNINFGSQTYQNNMVSAGLNISF
jgi:autotransporter-associated beta strand protein/T5SS/PEP-CTERM-associated repeat protein